MENPSPPRRHRLAWFALATFGALLLTPATRYLVRSQVSMETLTHNRPADRAAEQAAAARLSDDYPVQLAQATSTPSIPLVDGLPLGSDMDSSMSQSKARNRRIAVLAQRFPNNPSVYANLLRYMTMGEVRMMRNDGDPPPTTAAHATPYQPSPDAVQMFENAAQKGVELDPDNAYFRMMQAIGLFNAHRDSEALDALKVAGRCNHWTEYFQDEVDGMNRLQTAVYGERSAVQQTNNAACLLLPQYASLRAEARLVRYLAGQAELVGNTEEGVTARHALMRCGGLMRAQGDCYLTSLVGIAVTAIGTSQPGGIREQDTQTAALRKEDATQRRARRLQAYYSYLESIGHPEEASWARTEIAAGEQAKAIGADAIPYALFENRTFLRLGVSWLANLVLLSGVLVLVALGTAANLAGVLRPKRALAAWRIAYTLLILGGIGLWQWQATRGGMTPYLAIQQLGNGESMGEEAEWKLQSLVTGLSLLVPTLLVGTIAVMTLFQRVPLATGLGRGLRGVAIPVATGLFLLYGASLLPTASCESVIKARLAGPERNEARYYVEHNHKVWPGDPKP